MAVLTSLLLGLHLLAVNAASAVPLVCVWLHVRGRRGDVAADRAGRRLARAALAALIVGAGLGGLLVLMAWWDQRSGYWQAAGRFPISAYVFAALELVFSLVCLWIYARMWDRWLSKPWLHGLLAAASATNLLYHFPPLMVVLGELSVHPNFAADETISHAAFRQMMIRPGVLSLVVHFAVASLAVAGWALMAVAYQGRESRVRHGESSIEGRGPEESGAAFDSFISAGAWIALVATLAQLAVGLWVLVEMPIASRNSMLGGDWPGTALLFVSIVATFALLHLLASVALGDTSDRAVRRSVVLMLVIVLLMVGALMRVRRLDGSRREAVAVVARVTPARWNNERQTTPTPTWPAQRSRRLQPPQAVPA